MTDTNNLSDGATINLEAACAIVCLRCKQGGDGPKLIDGVWVHTFPTVAGREVCGANDLRNLPSTEATHDARLRRALKRCGHRLNRAHAWAARWKALAKRQRGPLRLCHSGECNAAEWWRARWQEWSDWARAELEQAGITEPQQVRWGSHTQRERLSALLRELKGRVTDAPPSRRVVVGVDPAVSQKRASDETGIVVAGVDVEGRVYVPPAAIDAAPEHGSRDRAKLHDGTAARAGPSTVPALSVCPHCGASVRGAWHCCCAKAEPPAPGKLQCDTCRHCDPNHDRSPWCTLYGIGIALRDGACRCYEPRSGKLARNPNGEESRDA